ncbi:MULTISPECIES: SDR family oxidoreductase [Streptomyces]|uniref:SDR family oxidoreductase n=1 Tax=Streptomyces TaxID=1883 RepID=UPI0004BD3F06|nr:MULTISPECIES: SDR family oxidoreductase [unclassified Streptomyces]
MGILANKSALVTGASRGIGRAIAERLGREGALVAVHYGHSSAAAREVVESIQSAGGRAFAVQAELGWPTAADELYRNLAPQLTTLHGKVELDILVNNAGVMDTAPLGRISNQDFKDVYAVNAKAPVFITQRLLPHIPDGGRILNISSPLTRIAQPNQLVHAMSKGALEQLTLHLAQLLGPRGITVNSVRPGFTDNGGPVFKNPETVKVLEALNAFGRVGRPADVADVVTFLASEEARWVTGSILDATGGTLLG